MKAIVWQGGKSFKLADVPKPEPGPKQVLVEVEAASICSTDFHYDDFQCAPPIVPGHEVAGIVTALGGEASGVEVGDKVTKGQTICIVEAMKNFNEIESEVDGIVEEMCVKNTELVEFGKVLFRIKLS